MYLRSSSRLLAPSYAFAFSIYPLLADVSELIAEEPEGELKDAIDRDFGSLDEFKKQFKAAGATQFGSGWAWLTKGKDGKLKVRHVSVTQALSILVRRMHVVLSYLEMSEAQQGEKLSWPCPPYSMTPIHAAAAAGLRRLKTASSRWPSIILVLLPQQQVHGSCPGC